MSKHNEIDVSVKTELTLNIKGTKIKLSKAEAEQLYALLSGNLNKTYHSYPYYSSYPSYGGSITVRNGAGFAATNNTITTNASVGYQENANQAPTLTDLDNVISIEDNKE